MKTAVTSEPEGGGAAYLKAILEMKQRKGHLSPIARLRRERPRRPL
jgi:hypothetical protein